MKRTRDDWLKEGVRILAEVGPTALTIDLLLVRLRMTKGSFYYHFRSYDGYTRALLTHIEQHEIPAVGQVAGESDVPRQQIESVLGWLLNHNPALEAALRTWASIDDHASVTQQHIDRERLFDLTTLCGQYLGDGSAGQGMANLLLAMLIARQQATPPMAVKAMVDAFRQAYGL
ncbi:MAG: TetR/AcrR family transcriptional regulator [Anaerolineaceae bacterium]|nr:TetR/AcrR family transcriptional regulator [Anaerolineaceae bacterium]